MKWLLYCAGGHLIVIGALQVFIVLYCIVLVIDWVAVAWPGRSHSRRRHPVKEKARSPKTVHNLGFTYWVVVVDSKPERPDEDETESRTSLRYGGQRPVCTICIHIHSLYRIPASTGSQCSWCNPSAIWSRWPRPCIRRAQHSVHVEVWIMMTSADQPGWCCSNQTWIV